jgi:hypothetical protein
MAISTINSQIRHMVLMTERHRLFRCDIDLLPSGAFPIPIRDDQSRDEKECCDTQGGAQEMVMLGRENESSASFISLRFHRQLGLVPKNRHAPSKPIFLKCLISNGCALNRGGRNSVPVRANNLGSLAGKNLCAANCRVGGLADRIMRGRFYGGNARRPKRE